MSLSFLKTFPGSPVPSGYCPDSLTWKSKAIHNQFLAQMQPHLSPLPLPPILQALSTLSPDLHILLSLWTFGVPSTQIALPPTHIVREMIISYQPKELAREAATCPPPPALTGFLGHCCQLVAVCEHLGQGWF